MNSNNEASELLSSRKRSILTMVGEDSWNIE